MSALVKAAADILDTAPATGRRSRGVPHGTPGGYSYYRCRCTHCLRAYRISRGGTPDGDGRRNNRFPRPAPAACGTKSGYLRHRNSGEKACPACLAAAAAYQRELRARKRGRS